VAPALLALLLASTPAALGAASPCDSALTSAAEECLQRELRAKDDTLRRFEAVVRARLSRRGVAVFDSAATTWRVYRGRECRTVYEFWEEGTVRGLQYLGCMLALTDERIAHLALAYFPPEGLPRDSVGAAIRAPAAGPAARRRSRPAI
jgi:uncharacterized protein YecT (DUF1311 family)